MRKSLTLFAILMSTVLSRSVFAQNLPLYDQYHFNQLIFNPAYAGSKNAFETNIFVHQHTSNMLGAPTTQSFTAHLPVSNDKVGLGVKIYHDKIGATNATAFAFDYAYRAHLNTKFVVAIGLEASLTNYSINYAELDAFKDGDPAFGGKVDSYIKPNFGAGIYLHSNNFYLGVSTPTILTDKNVSTSDVGKEYDDIFNQTTNTYATIGVLLKITDNFSIKPDAMLKIGNNIPSQADVNMNLILYNTLLVGGGYRTNNSFSFVAEYMFTSTDILQNQDAGLGYSYNSVLGNDAAFFGPSHEVFLVYRFHKNKTNIKNPRFF